MQKFMIDGMEAVALREHIDQGLMEQAINIAEACREHPPRDDGLWGNILLFATLYNAGRVDGIRCERARRLPSTKYLLESIEGDVAEIIPLCTIGRFEFARDALEALFKSICNART